MTNMKEFFLSLLTIVLLHLKMKFQVSFCGLVNYDVDFTYQVSSVKVRKGMEIDGSQYHNNVIEEM